MTLRELSPPEALAYASATVEIEHADDLRTMTEERAAELGAIIMDEHFPGWAAKINVGTLHIYDTRSCILGQVTGSFSRGIDHLRQSFAEKGFGDLDSRYLNAPGLNAFHTMTWHGRDWDAARLDDAWKQEIRNRLSV